MAVRKDTYSSELATRHMRIDSLKLGKIYKKLSCPMLRVIEYFTKWL